jgi:ATP-dependent Clp protease ATP-binding subunit ClpB
VIRDAVMGVVGTHFRPEFINRIDDAVVFHALGRDHIRGILDVQLSYLRARLEEMEYGFELTDEVAEKLCEAGYDPVYGARPLKRAIQIHLENPLAEALLKGEFAPGETIKAVLSSSGEITFSG